MTLAANLTEAAEVSFVDKSVQNTNVEYILYLLSVIEIHAAVAEEKSIRGRPYLLTDRQENTNLVGDIEYLLFVNIR